jgi:succinylglutamic semialdehyde dehydrogenase
MSSHFIHNAWHDGTGPAFWSENPATGERLATYRAATAAEVDQALRAARAAFESWSLLPVEQRIAHVTAFADLLKTEKSRGTPDSLPHLIAQETGKPLWESLTELDAMINKIPLSIQAMKERRGPSVSTTHNQTTATRYKPHGVVAVFGPFNFPGHLPNGHIVPALLAGNTVVFKPSELTPGVAQRTVELWHQSGLPAGVLNLVQGARETGQALASHPDIDGLFFTGSVAAGRALSRLLADSPHKILALEMGGNNPLVLWNATDTQAAALLTIQSAYQTTGQRCSCARRLILETGPRGDALLDRLLALIP